MWKNKLIIAVFALFLSATDAFALSPGGDISQLCQNTGYIVAAEVMTISKADDFGNLLVYQKELFKGSFTGPKIEVKWPFQTLGSSVALAPGNLVLLFLNYSEAEGKFESSDPLQGLYIFDSGQAVRPAFPETLPWVVLTDEIRMITAAAKPTGIELSTWGKIKELFR